MGWCITRPRITGYWTPVLVGPGLFLLCSLLIDVVAFWCGSSPPYRRPADTSLLHSCFLAAQICCSRLSHFHSNALRPIKQMASSRSSRPEPPTPEDEGGRGAGGRFLLAAAAAAAAGAAGPAGPAGPFAPPAASSNTTRGGGAVPGGSGRAAGARAVSSYVEGTEVAASAATAVVRLVVFIYAWVFVVRSSGRERDRLLRRWVRCAPSFQRTPRCLLL